MQEAIIWPETGRYIVAVSGGADSMALLHLMSQASASREYDLVVAHFDHGMRPESGRDADLVADVAHRYGLEFEVERAKLGQASEASARVARYTWLFQVCDSRHARAVITAHHEDDLIETSILNLARGTGHIGLAPMQHSKVLRPLLAVTRAQLRDYAATQKLRWHEDETNGDRTNPRNFLRHVLLPAAPPHWRQRYVNEIADVAKINREIAQNIAELTARYRTDNREYKFPYDLLRDLSLPEVAELIAAASRELVATAELDRRLIQEVAVFAKTSRPHTYRPLRHGLVLKVGRTDVRLTLSE